MGGFLTMGVMYVVLILFNIFHVVYPRCQTLNSKSHGILIPNYKDPGNDECLNNIVFETENGKSYCIKKNAVGPKELLTCPDPLDEYNSRQLLGMNVQRAEVLIAEKKIKHLNPESMERVTVTELRVLSNCGTTPHDQINPTR